MARALVFATPILLWLAGSIRMCAGQETGPPKARRVLCVHSYSVDSAWAVNVRKGIREAFKDVSFEVEFYDEWMDAKRFVAGKAPVDLPARIAAFLSHKYAPRPPDAIVVADNAAYDMVLVHRESFFPKAPVVFCGVNDFDPSALAGRPDITGVVEEYDLRETLRIISRLQPQVTRVIAVSDQTATGRLHAARYRRETPLPDLPEVVYEIVSDKALREVETLLREADPETTVALYLSFYRDPDGRNYTDREAVGRVSECGLPVYTCWDDFLPYGAFGGMLTSGVAQGRRAGEMVLAILEGTPVKDLAVETRSPNEPIFNYAGLERFDIPRRRLPEGSRVIGGSGDLFRRYARWLWIGGAVIALQALTIAALIAMRRRRRQIEKVLRAGERRYQDLFDNAPVGYHEIDPEGNIVRVNRTEARMLGYAVEEMVGRPVYGFVAEQDRDTARESVARKFAGGEPLHGVDRTFLKRDGTLVPVRLDEQFVTDAAGNVVGIRTAVTDVTAHRMAETRLRESENLLRTVMKVSRDVVYMLKLDPLGYEYVSPGAEDLLGFSAETMVEKGPSWFVSQTHPQDSEHMHRRMGLMREGQPEKEFLGHREYRWQVADGSWRWLSDNHAMLRDEDGHPSAIVGTIRDITEQRRQLEDLARSEERFRSVLEMSRDMAYKVNLGKMTYDYVSPASLTLLGFTTAEMVRQGVSWYNSRIHPEDRKRLDEVLETDSVEHFVPAIEYRWLDRDGEYRWLSDSRALVRDDSGEAVAIVGTVRDITEERRAQEVLREATRSATDIVQYIPSGLFIYQYAEPDRLVLLAGNPEAGRLTGLDIETCTGKEFDAIWPNASDAGIKENFLEVVRSGSPHRWEDVDYSDEHTRGVFRIHAFPMPGGRLGVAFEELGRQRRTEEALARTEQRYHMLFNSMIDAFALHKLVYDDEGNPVDYRFLEVNPAFEEMTGMTAEQVVGRRAYEVLPELEPFWLQTYAEVVRTGRSRRFEHYETVFGKHFQTVAYPAPDDCFATIFVDVTERVRAQQALEAQKERLRVTLMSIGDGVISTDAEGGVLMMNTVAERLTGLTQAEARGRPLEEVFRIVNEQTRQPVESPVRKVLAEGRIVGLANHTLLIAADGTERAIADSGAPIRNHRGELVGVVLVFRDVTQERAVEAEMVKSQKLESVGLLAGGIAHDFNNYLTAILGNLSLARVSDHPDKVDERLAEAERAAKWARDLTQQLLTFSKGGTPVKHVVDTGQLIREAAVFALRGKGMIADVEMPEDLWPVEVDPGQIGQVVHNLAVNAEQASPQGSSVEFRAENVELAESRGGLKPGRYVRLKVIDRGSGIAPSVLGRIFDPYFSTKPRNSGLGLTTSYSIVRNHDGLIEVDSARGKGSTFTVYLPASGRDPVIHDKDVSDLAGQGRLLVMDDEEMVRDVASAVLADLGYEVDVAADGRQALELYRRAAEAGAPYDLVITDLTVPGGMGGRELIGKLREIDPKVKAIVSSGYSNDPVLGNPEDHGFLGIVSKPYEVEDLAAEVKRVLEGREKE